MPSVARPRVWAAILTLAISSGCAARRFTPPAGPSQPEPRAAALWEQATSRCRDARLYVAEIRVNGQVGAAGQRLAATMHGAVTQQEDLYLEVPTIAGPVLRMAGRQGRVTFLLPNDRRVLLADTRDVVGALTGLNWGGRELLAVLSGCVVPVSGAVTGVRVNGQLRISISADAEAWLMPHEGAWRLHAARVDGWWLEYRRHDVFWPAEIRVTSQHPIPLDLRFTVSQVQTNVELPESAFTLEVPPGYDRLSLDELRAIGPLRERGERERADLPPLAADLPPLAADLPPLAATCRYLRCPAL